MPLNKGITIGASAYKGHAAWLASGLDSKRCSEASALHRFFSKTSDFDMTKTHRLLLQALVRKIGSHPILDQKRDIALRHSWLQDKVDTFQKQAGSMLHIVSDDTNDS
jgi:hypothetical protein